MKVGSMGSRLETVSDSERDQKRHPRLVLDTIEEKINLKVNNKWDKPKNY